MFYWQIIEISPWSSSSKLGDYCLEWLWSKTLDLSIQIHLFQQSQRQVPLRVCSWLDQEARKQLENRSCYSFTHFQILVCSALYRLCDLAINSGLWWQNLFNQAVWNMAMNVEWVLFLTSQETPSWSKCSRIFRKAFLKTEYLQWYECVPSDIPCPFCVQRRDNCEAYSWWPQGGVGLLTLTLMETKLETRLFMTEYQRLSHFPSLHF